MWFVNYVCNRNIEKFKNQIRETQEWYKLGFIDNSGRYPEGQNVDTKEDAKDYTVRLMYEFWMWTRNSLKLDQRSPTVHADK